MTRAATHAVFLPLLAAGVTLRILAMIGFPGILWFVGDSGTYLEAALNFKPSLIRPSGYSVFLFLLRPFHSLALVAAVQHLMGLATGVLIYLLVWRAAGRITRPWLRSLLGSVAAAPVLLDGYQIQLEHLLMADELFAFLAFAAVAVILWRPALTWRTASPSGALLACAALTRSVGLPLLVVLLAWLAIHRMGWRTTLSAAVAFAVPMLAYLAWFKVEHHTIELTRTDSIWLYGRTADFADCARIKPPPELRRLCPGPRVPGVSPSNQAMWSAESGLRTYRGGIGGVEANQRAGEFAWDAVKAQPFDYLRVVVRDTFRAFGWGHDPYPTAQTLDQYRFPSHVRPLTSRDPDYAHRYDSASAHPRTVGPPAGWMRDYQRWVFLPGPLLGLIMIAGLVGVVRRWRRFGGDVALPWVCALALLVVPAATADFDYRYVLPAVPFACLAAALTVAAWRPTD